MHTIQSFQQNRNRIKSLCTQRSTPHTITVCLIRADRANICLVIYTPIIYTEKEKKTYKIDASSDRYAPREFRSSVVAHGSAASGRLVVEHAGERDRERADIRRATSTPRLATGISFVRHGDHRTREGEPRPSAPSIGVASGRARGSRHGHCYRRAGRRDR